MTSQSAFSFPDQSSFSTQQTTFNSFSPGQTYNIIEPVTTSQPNPQTSTNFQNQQFQQYHTATLSSNNAKFPYLKKDEYETWAMKMEYWIMNTDHNLWKIIQNGNNKKMLGRVSKGGIIILPPVSFEEHLAVKARFGGNEESKKMRKTMLKQAFSEFSVSEEEGLHKSYDRSLEIDVKGGSSYGTRSTTIAPTHSAFIVAASTNTKMVYSDQPSYSSLISYTPVPSGSIMEDMDQLEMEELDIKWQMAMLSLRINKFQKKASRNINFNNKDSARFDRRKARCYNFPADNAAGGVNPAAVEFAMMGNSPKAKLEKKVWEVKFVESLARFDKCKESSKNLTKLLYSSMSTRTKLGLGFKDYIGSDEVCDLSTPSVFDPEPDAREVKSLYERFVKAGKMHEVPPPIIGTFMPTSYQSDLGETQATFGLKSNTSSIPTFESTDFVSCDNTDKSSASETYDFASCVSSPKTSDSFSTIDVKLLPKSDVKDPSLTNDLPSCCFKENVKSPRNICNKSVTADRIPCKNTFVRPKKCFVCVS
nr:hypothetical protein [Tanacetum cinerariifolium]